MLSLFPSACPELAKVPLPSLIQTVLGSPKEFATIASRSPSPSRSPRATDSQKLYPSACPESVKVPVPSLVQTVLGWILFTNMASRSPSPSRSPRATGRLFLGHLFVVGEGAGAIVDPDGVGVGEVRDHGVEVAVTVEVAEGDGSARLFQPSSCPELVKVPVPSLVQTVSGWLEFPTMASRSPSPSRSPRATDWLAVSECLSGVGEGAVAVVDPDGVGLELASKQVGVRDHGIEVAVTIEVAEGDFGAESVSEHLSVVGEGAGAIVDPGGVGLFAVFATMASRSPSPSRSPRATE